MGLHVYPSFTALLVLFLPKQWVSLQTTTSKSKSTKYFNIFLLITCEEVLHAPTVQI